MPVSVPVMAPKLEPLQVPVLAALEEDYTKLVQSVVPSVVSITTRKRIRQRVPVVVDAFDLIFGTRQQRVVEQTETGLGSEWWCLQMGCVLTSTMWWRAWRDSGSAFTDGRIEPAGSDRNRPPDGHCGFEDQGTGDGAVAGGFG